MRCIGEQKSPKVGCLAQGAWVGRTKSGRGQGDERVGMESRQAGRRPCWESPVGQGLPQPCDLSARLLHVARVPEGEVGASTLGLDGELGLFACIKLRRGPAALPCPGEAKLTGRINEDKLITQLIPTGLKKQRCVEYNDGAGGGGQSLQMAANHPADLRVSPLLKDPPFSGTIRRRGKDDLCQSAPVNSAIAAENAITPTTSGGSLDFRKAKCFVAGTIRVENLGPRFG